MLRMWLKMAWLVVALSSSALLSAQLPGQQPPTMPGQQPQLPPDANQPAKPEHHHPISTKDLQSKLQKGLENKNAAYSGSNIKVAVDDQTVTLSGTVTSSIQHEMALQLVRAYGDDRQIVDQLVVQ